MNITQFLQLSDQIIKYLRIKKVPHYTTIQKFFQKLPSGTLRKINQLILSQHDISGEIIALDGSWIHQRLC
ncbi:hypothetical protein ACA135_04135 [Methanobrevibacter acididurans]|uniref:hypothetical protein n=1 Tax=Methanobrevibacter acididurans TaxID=120963 RepID=UPI0038FC8EA4